MLESTLFNGHDFVVLLAGVFAGLLALLLQSLPYAQHRQQSILSGFFVLCAIHSIDTLIYWNPNINRLVSGFSSYCFFLGWPALFLQGPALYFAAKSQLQSPASSPKRIGIHAAPAIVSSLILIVIYFSQPEVIRQEYIHNWSAVKSHPGFAFILWTQTLSLAIYSSAAWLKWRQHRRPDASRWLALLVGGFLLINSWRLGVLLGSYYLSSHIIYILGTIENYLRLTIIASLFVCWLRQLTASIAIPVTLPEKIQGTTSLPTFSTEDNTLESYNPPALRRLQKHMQESKPYLQSNINLERLAAQLDMSPKQLSGLINKQLQQNFFEMIRNYRIEEAQRRLADEGHIQQSINEIMMDCGFNSKSVFNQAFKDKYGITPGQYRKQRLGL